MPRTIWTRDFYIPKDSTKLDTDESSAVVYTYNTNKSVGAMGFQGRRQKPTFHYLFKDVAKRDKYVEEFFESVKEQENYKRQRKAVEQAKGRGLEVGDVMVSSWGYEQTNVDFYQVTRLVGKKSVELRKIGYSDHKTDGFLTGTCRPAPDCFVGEPFVKRAKDGSVTLTSYSWAHRCPRDAERRWSSYH